ncbi:hypothetical protein AKJ16_DCAP08834 [Drosera capensis]
MYSSFFPILILLHCHMKRIHLAQGQDISLPTMSSYYGPIHLENWYVVTWNAKDYAQCQGFCALSVVDCRMSMISGEARAHTMTQASTRQAGLKHFENLSHLCIPSGLNDQLAQLCLPRSVGQQMVI